jgi:uncharacterized protein YbaP (TraB family)
MFSRLLVFSVRAVRNGLRNSSMRPVIASIFLVVLFCSVAFAESSVWKVQKGTSVVYLGGTCHLLRESDFPLPPEFQRAYDASRVVVFETDIVRLQDPSTQLKLLSRATYADGSGVEKHLSSRAYAELSAYCQANGIPLDALGQIKPSLLMVTLTVMELARTGVGQQGVDLFFHDAAVRDGKTVDGLEDVDQQIDYVVSMADGNEDEFVIHSLRELKFLSDRFASFVDAWRRGDTGKLERLMVAELRTEQPVLYRKMIVERNRNWLPRIDAYLKSPETEFILVGAGHLVGPDGLIEALRKKGCRVEKL